MWRRRSKTECEPENVRRAREAAERAAMQRRRVEAQASDAREIGAEIREALRRNHFGEQIDRAFRRRGVV